MSVRKRAIAVAVVIAVMLAASVASIIYMKYGAKQGKTARIYRDNELLYEIDLSAVKDTYTLTIEYGDDGYNVIEVQNGSIGIIDASCPDKLCEHMGFIQDAAVPVTCLPNHLVIKIENNGITQSEPDGVAY